MIPFRETEDWIGAWFPVMEAMGEETSIRYIEINLNTREETHYPVPHQMFDGIGGLCHVTRQVGLDIGSPPVNRIHKVSFLKRLFGLWHYLLKSKPFHTPWKQYQPQSPNPKSPLLWRSLSRVETAQLKKITSAQNCSINSCLIHTIDSVCRTHLLANSEVVNRWWIPVNLRGAYDLTNPLGNHSSHILADIKPGATITDVHAGIKKQLQSGFHLGALASSLWAKHLSFAQMRKILEGYNRKNHCCMGTISHFGEWSSGDLDDSTLWVGNPPSTVSFPLSFGITIWNKQLVLSVHVHQALCPMSPSLEHLLDSVLAKLKGYLYANADQYYQLSGPRDCDSY